MSEFAKLAQDFVEATSLLVGQRTINIMDQKGIIIASTEKHRIGDFHQGAAEVLETGKPVLIKIEDLPRYPGTTEGYNMPMRSLAWLESSDARKKCRALPICFVSM